MFNKRLVRLRLRQAQPDRSPVTLSLTKSCRSLIEEGFQKNIAFVMLRLTWFLEMPLNISLLNYIEHLPKVKFGFILLSQLKH